MDRTRKQDEAGFVFLPELVLEVDDLPLLGLVLGDQVLQLPLDLPSLGLLARNLLFRLVQGSLQGLQTVVHLETRKQ